MDDQRRTRNIQVSLTVFEDYTYCHVFERSHGGVVKHIGGVNSYNLGVGLDDFAPDDSRSTLTTLLYALEQLF